MAVALATGTKVYPLTMESNFRDKFVQFLEVNITAANTDTAVNLATLAAADAVNGPAIVDALNACEKVLDYMFLESARATAAATTAHTYNGSATAPAWTFAGGGTTPTVLTLKLCLRLKAGANPILSGI